NNALDPDPRGPGFTGPAPVPSFPNPGDPTSGLGPRLTPLPSDLAGSRYTTRQKDWYALQEAFGEIHIRDLTNNYDFLSSRFGIQPFVSDFRGFIFNDSNLGLRLFGNYDNNRWQYNVIAFDMREKDTYSDLNKFDARDQRVRKATPRSSASTRISTKHRATTIRTISSPGRRRSARFAIITCRPITSAGRAMATSGG
ncbi:MAG: hypothetical protein DME70_10990, partial [Verrucomicrobia bacterium]